MGLMSKFSTKPSNKLAAATGGKASSGMPVDDPDDEATIFTTFMVLYYGFFGITLLFYPWFHSADWNPMAYWTKISDELAFGFRIAGVGMLALVLGPFLDEIFGGAGVKMMAFSRQMFVANLCVWILFMYYSFYAPLSTAVTIMWQAQALLAGIILGWNFIEIFDEKKYYALFVTALFTPFGVGLVAAPEFLFGPASPFTYWKVWADLTVFCAQSLGISILVLFGLGYLYFGSAPGYAKLCTFTTAINMGLFIMPAFYGGSSPNASMWQLQIVLTTPFLISGLYMELVGVTGKWEFAMPKFGPFLSVDTFLFVNLLFYIPFVGAFATDPNMVFGPKTPTGFPMFTTALDETGLWFGRAWAVAMFTLVISPYLFGLKEIKVVKQLTIAYAGFTALIGYGLYSSSVFNFIVVAPLDGLNFLFFLWGLFLCLPAQAGEPMV